MRKEMKQLLLKYISGDCSEQEKYKVINWLDSDPENMRKYLALRKLNDISIWQANQNFTFLHSRKRKISLFSGNYFIEGLKIAGVFVIAFFAYQYLVPQFLPQRRMDQMQTLHVPAGQRAEITLNDGTIVWLNANSTLKFPSRFSNKYRVVNLEGEGFFEVIHDKSCPFIVKTSQFNVKVWGTKFNLDARSDSKYFKTSLLAGSVEVLAPGSKSGIILKPNEQASLVADKMVVSQIRNRDQFLWREGIISFDNATFSEIMEKLKIYFNVKIKVLNPQLLKYRYTGKFRMKDGVKHILDVLELKNKFTYRIDNNLNEITIK